MARARDPNRDRAFEIWREHDGNITNRQIAEQLGVDEKKISVWKQRDKWNVVQQSQNNVVQQTDSNVVQQKKRSRGAQPGNKNAVGNSSGAPIGNKRAVGNKGGPGGPIGNKKAVTTGEYESIWLDTLDDQEQELLELINTDPVMQANDALLKLELRERRMLMRIKRLTEGLSEKERRVLHELKAIKDAMTVHDEKTGVTKTVPITKTQMVESEIEEKEYRKIDDILALEEALTRVQDKKLKAIELKSKLTDALKQLQIERLEHELLMLRGGGKEEVQDDGFIAALRGRAAEVWSDGKA
ncbi:phage terminase small subunit-related protein [Paenibacillus polymyxa]|uniref:phage terminase small subunit-related protein n=1 Tax=Paenibacillus polymyxa TaxID=1406 RepID=UPI002024462D|nr:phage terminase small subunit-related protein [Paenibacillus polymyxa]URJ36596.1 phage terminase small subunit-related protein [Paenibacillus polymyxa]